MWRLISWVHVVRALIALVSLHFHLKRTGFHGVFPWYVKRYGRNCSQRLHGEWRDAAAQWLWAIDMACRLVPWEARCLHRSLLGYRFLREQVGVPVELVVGVRKFPFKAHAWLTLEGQCINEEPQFVARFAAILRSQGGQVV